MCTLPYYYVLTTGSYSLRAVSTSCSHVILFALNLARGRTCRAAEAPALQFGKKKQAPCYGRGGTFEAKKYR